VVRADDRRVRVAGHVAEADADLIAAPELVAADDREDVGLVVLEQAPRIVGVIFALRARQRVRDPAEEALPQLLAHEELAAEDAPLALVGERRIARVLA